MLGLPESESPVLPVKHGNSWAPPQSHLNQSVVAGIGICILNKHPGGALCSLKFANLYLPFLKVYSGSRGRVYAARKKAAALSLRMLVLPRHLHGDKDPKSLNRLQEN